MSQSSPHTHSLPLKPPADGRESPRSAVMIVVASCTITSGGDGSEGDLGLLRDDDGKINGGGEDDDGKSDGDDVD
nr:hypothetical protein [Tanacetum cinerariifolium]